jgi:hypothetical protein
VAEVERGTALFSDNGAGCPDIAGDGGYTDGGGGGGSGGPTCSVGGSAGVYSSVVRTDGGGAGDPTEHGEEHGAEPGLSLVSKTVKNQRTTRSKARNHSLDRASSASQTLDDSHPPTSMDGPVGNLDGGACGNERPDSGSMDTGTVSTKKRARGGSVDGCDGRGASSLGPDSDRAKRPRERKVSLKQSTSAAGDLSGSQKACARKTKDSGVGVTPAVHLKNCRTCDTVTSKNDSIECRACESRLHLKCLNLPAAVKPSVVSEIVALLSFVCASCRADQTHRVVVLESELLHLRQEFSELKQLLSAHAPGTLPGLGLPKVQGEGRGGEAVAGPGEGGRGGKGAAGAEGDLRDAPPGGGSISARLKAIAGSDSGHASTNLTGSAGTNLPTFVDMVKAVRQTVSDATRRKRNIIVSGVPESSASDDARVFVELCESDLNLKPRVRVAKRLGKPSSLGRPRRLLITLESESTADDLITCARQLRNSRDDYTANNIYINRDLTPEEEAAAFDRRVSRRANPTNAHQQRPSVAAGGRSGGRARGGPAEGRRTPYDRVFTRSRAGGDDDVDTRSRGGAEASGRERFITSATPPATDSIRDCSVNSIPTVIGVVSEPRIPGANLGRPTF